MSQNAYWVMVSPSGSEAVNRVVASVDVSPWVAVTFDAVTTGGRSGPGVAVKPVQAPHANPSFARTQSVSGVEPNGPNT